MILEYNWIKLLTRKTKTKFNYFCRFNLTQNSKQSPYFKKTRKKFKHNDEVTINLFKKTWKKKKNANAKCNVLWGKTARMKTNDFYGKEITYLFFSPLPPLSLGKKSNYNLQFINHRWCWLRYFLSEKNSLVRSFAANFSAA